MITRRSLYCLLPSLYNVTVYSYACKLLAQLMLKINCLSVEIGIQYTRQIRYGMFNNNRLVARQPMTAGTFFRLGLPAASLT